MIKINNLNKTYKNKKIFDNLNISIKENKLTFIVGDSGIGKTTLLNIISNYEKMDNGEIIFSKPDPKISMIFQNYNLLENFSFKDNLQISKNINGNKFDDKEVESLIQKFNLNFENPKILVKNLSGGEKQRLAILRSFYSGADIILADEPTGNLDENNSKIVFEILKRISKNKTIVVVSHDLDAAKKYADEIIYLNKSEIQIKENLNQNNNYLNQNNNIILENQKDKIGKIKLLPKFAWNEFKNKKIQFFFMFIILVFSFLCLGIFSKFHSSSQQVNKSNIVYTNADKIDVYNDNFWKNNTFNNQEIDNIKKIKNIKDVVLNYDIEPYLKDENDQILDSIKNFEFLAIKNNDYFKQRFISNIEGRFIENDNEIIVSEKISKASEKPILNSYIKLHLNNSNEYLKLKVVGINKLIDLDNKNNTLISENALKTLKTSSLKALTLESNKKEAFEIINNKKYINNFDVNEINPLENITLISGNIPNNEDEILISSALNENNNFEIGKYYFIKKEGSNILKESIKIKFTGIFQSNKMEIKVLNNFIDYLRKPFPNRIEIYTKNYENFDIEKEILNLNSNFKISSKSNTAIQNILNSSKTLIFVLFGSISILSIIFIFILCMYINTSINQNKKQIGILKTLGGKTIQVLFYHLFIFIILFILTYLTSIILVFPFNTLLELFFKNLNILKLDFNSVVSFISIFWSILFVVSLLLYISISIKIFKKKTILLLK